MLKSTYQVWLFAVICRFKDLLDKQDARAIAIANHLRKFRTGRLNSLWYVMLHTQLRASCVLRSQEIGGVHSCPTITGLTYCGFEGH